MSELMSINEAASQLNLKVFLQILEEQKRNEFCQERDNAGKILVYFRLS